jgi:hypothetical protein
MEMMSLTKIMQSPRGDEGMDADDLEMFGNTPDDVALERELYHR